MTAVLGCGDVRALAPDVALDLLAGDERAAALEHLGGCAGCRLEVEELASVADSLLLLGPLEQPSPEFDAAVLARIRGDAERVPAPRPALGHRRLVRAGLVAACLLLGAGLLLAAPRPGSAERRADFLSASGGATGEVLLTDGDPDRMTCTVDNPHFKGPYGVELVLDDGTRRSMGGFEVDGGRYTWGTALPVDADRIVAVEVQSPDGTVRSTAVFDS